MSLFDKIAFLPVSQSLGSKNPKGTLESTWGATLIGLLVTVLLQQLWVAVGLLYLPTADLAALTTYYRHTCHICTPHMHTTYTCTLRYTVKASSTSGFGEH